MAAAFAAATRFPSCWSQSEVPMRSRKQPTRNRRGATVPCTSADGSGLAENRSIAQQARMMAARTQTSCPTSFAMD